MSESLPSTIEKALPKTLRFRDLVLLNVASVASLTTLSQVAQFGYASIILLVIAVFTFFIPCGLMVAELNYRMPEQGGFYIWIKKAFGPLHGYIAAWAFWLCNIVWFPTALLLISSSVPYLLGPEYIALKDDLTYNSIFCLGVLWAVTLLNIGGMEKAKWVQNLGALASWLAIALLVIVGVWYVQEFGLAQPFSRELLIPDWTDYRVWPFFAAVVFSFGGLELGAVMSGEMENPRRNVPRALVYAGLMVGSIYILGTIMVIALVPNGEVSTIEGIAQAFFNSSAAFQSPWTAILGISLLIISALGLFGAWFAGNARIPFVIGLDNYLPESVSRLHPKYGSPYISLIGQAIVISILFLGTTLGTTIKDAFQILFDMSILLYFIPFLYMFAALFYHVKNGDQKSGLFSFLERKSILVLLVGSGLFLTIFAMILSVIPSGQVEEKGLFVLKVLGGAILLLSIGMVAYFRKKVAKPV